MSKLFRPIGPLGFWTRTVQNFSGRVPDPEEGEIQPEDKERNQRMKSSRIEDPLM